MKGEFWMRARVWVTTPRFEQRRTSVGFVCPVPEQSQTQLYFEELTYKSEDYIFIVRSFEESVYGVASWAALHVRAAHTREDALELRDKLVGNNIQELAEHLFEYMIAMYRGHGIELEHLSMHDCRTWLTQNMRSLASLLREWSEAPHRYPAHFGY